MAELTFASLQECANVSACLQEQEAGRVHKLRYSMIKAEPNACGSVVKN